MTGCWCGGTHGPYGPNLTPAPTSAMCCLCFEVFPLDQLHHDAIGPIDVCEPCWVMDQELARRKGLRKGIQ